MEVSARGRNAARVRSCARRTNQGRQFSAKPGHLDGQVDECVLEAERRGGQREPLAGAANCDPVRLVFAFCEEDHDAGRGFDMPRVLVVLRRGAEEGVERATPKNSGNGGLPEATENSPSPDAMALPGLKRSHAFSSAMKAGSAICSSLPATTRSRALSIRARSVSTTMCTPGIRTARCSASISEAGTGRPS